jgi:alpha-methylacyl-CoA racemase
MTLGEVARDLQTKAREMIVEVPLSDGKTIRQFAHPVKFSRTTPRHRFAGVPAGTHNWEIMLTLGYTLEEIETFAVSGLFD